MTVKNINELSEWHRAKKPLYESLAIKVEDIIKDVLKNAGIEVYSISSRAKKTDSFLKKAKKDKYSDPVNEIKDFAGIRVITFVRSDVEKCCDLIKPLFKIDELNSIDKGKELGKDKVGYRSVHYVAELTDQRLALPDFFPFSNMCFEIQVRTILEHAWADISHDRTYKFSGKLPPDDDIERRFSLAAATLELVDREFDTIALKLDKYKNTVINETAEGNLEIGINSTSLNEYMKMKFANLIEKQILDPSFYNGEEDIIEELVALDINTLADLDNLIGDTDKFNNISKNTFLGLLRDSMVIYNAEEYFSKAWSNHWNGIDPETYDFYVQNNVDIRNIMEKFKLHTIPYPE